MQLKNQSTLFSTQLQINTHTGILSETEIKILEHFIAASYYYNNNYSESYNKIRELFGLSKNKFLASRAKLERLGLISHKTKSFRNRAHYSIHIFNIQAVGIHIVSDRIRFTFLAFEAALNEQRDNSCNKVNNIYNINISLNNSLKFSQSELFIKLKYIIMTQNEQYFDEVKSKLYDDFEKRDLAAEYDTWLEYCDLRQLEYTERQTKNKKREWFTNVKNATKKALGVLNVDKIVQSLTERLAVHDFKVPDGDILRGQIEQAVFIASALKRKFWKIMDYSIENICKIVMKLARGATPRKLINFAFKLDYLIGLKCTDINDLFTVGIIETLAPVTGDNYDNSIWSKKETVIVDVAQTATQYFETDVERYQRYKQRLPFYFCCPGLKRRKIMEDFIYAYENGLPLPAHDDV